MIRIGLIGCGFMGKMHSECYKKIPGVEIAAVADVRRDFAEKIAEGTNAVIYSEAKDLIENACVDAIDICLPTYLHAKYALMGMDKVKYLICEKPLAYTVEEGRQMLEKAKATGCNVQVGQSIRFNEIYGILKDIVDSGKYGKIENADFHRISPRPDWGWEDWLLDHKRSGGAAQDMHVHDVDFALYLFGRPKATTVRKNIIGEKNCYIVTTMQYPDFSVVIEGTWNMPKTYPFNEGFRIKFEKAALEYKDGKVMVYDDDSAEEIQLKGNDLGTVEGGNVSDLGEYYTELTYFTDRIKAGEKIEKAKIDFGFETLDYLLGIIG